MVEIRCQNCGRIVEVEKDWDTNATCDECAGEFAEVDSERDTYFPKESKEDESESNTNFYCKHCKNHITKEQKNPSDECDECGDSPLCDNCFVKLKEVSICKKCINKVYPREIKTEVKEVVKFIESNPSYKTFNPEEKNKFE